MVQFLKQTRDQCFIFSWSLISWIRLSAKMSIFFPMLRIQPTLDFFHQIAYNFSLWSPFLLLAWLTNRKLWRTNKTHRHINGQHQLTTRKFFLDHRIIWCCNTSSKQKTNDLPFLGPWLVGVGFQQKCQCLFPMLRIQPISGGEQKIHRHLIERRLFPIPWTALEMSYH